MDSRQLDQIRANFPLAQQCVYLNHASVSPLASSTRRAMERVLAELNQAGPPADWQAALAKLDRIRRSLAQMIGAYPRDIAFTKNTSEGLLMVAQGLSWRPGDRVVTFECEFPANIYPWLALRRQGVQLDLISPAALEDLDRLREALQGARLLSVSFVQYLSGFRADLEAIGALCREAGVIFVVDGIQGVGAFPIDVRHAGIHALAADGHKWLTGPEGAGFLYVAPELLEQLTPPEAGWLSVAEWNDLTMSHGAALVGRLDWRPGAARFECGSLNMVGVAGLGAASDMLQEVGIKRIGEHLLGIGDRLRPALLQRGCELLSIAGSVQAPLAAPAAEVEGKLRPLRRADDPLKKRRAADEPQERRSGITTFRHPTLEADTLVAKLATDRIICSSRSGWVRCSPHLYNTTEDLDRFLAAIP